MLPASAADIYVSDGPGHSALYSTQPLDSTYRLVGDSGVAVPKMRKPNRGPVAASGVKSMIERAALRHGLPSNLAVAVAGVESDFVPHARSRAGALGVMQLMPATARRYGLDGSEALLDAERNVDAGVRHLKDLMVRYRGNVALALAAYNAGPGAVARHGERIPPYPETMLYVTAVLARADATPRP